MTSATPRAARAPATWTKIGFDDGQLLQLLFNALLIRHRQEPPVKNFRWAVNRLHDLRRLERGRRKYGGSWVAHLARFVALTRARQFSPDEIFLLGLTDPAVCDAEIDRYVSKETMLARQLALNPREHHRLTEDKLVFHAHCQQHGLPTPAVLAAWGAGCSGDDAVAVARTDGEWLDICARLVADDLVLKPVAGVHGEGVVLLKRCGEVFVDHSGNTVDARDLLATMRASDYRDWILQQRLYAHPDMVAFTGSDKLQTARVVTWIDDDGSARVAFAWLRVIRDAQAFDNFNFGVSGNFVATVDLADGTLQYALAGAADGLGLVEVERHPASGRAFRGFAVPHAREMFRLALRAAECFRPLRTIGWDLAIARSGVALIEGNVTWDPLPTRASLVSCLQSPQRSAPRHEHV